MDDNIKNKMESLKVSEMELYEELKTINRLADFLAWEYKCDLAIDKFRELINNKSLKVGPRQSLISRCVRLQGHLEILRRQYIHVGGGIKRKALDSHEFYWHEIETAFSGRLFTGAVMNVDYIDPKQFLNEAEDMVVKHIKEYLEKFHNIKVNTTFNGEFMVKDKVDVKSFNTKNHVLYTTSDLHQWYTDHVIEPIMRKLEEFQERDSGWSLSRILNLMININKHNPMHAGCFEDLPKDIKNKKAIINIETNDDACFAYAVVTALHPAKSHLNKAYSYPEYRKVLKLEGIEFPMTLTQIPKFEKMNDISINIYTDERYMNSELKECMIVPIHLSKEHQEERHANLFYIPKGENSGHFAAINNLSRLVSSQLSRHHGKKYLCNR